MIIGSIHTAFPPIPPIYKGKKHTNLILVNNSQKEKKI